MRRADNLLTFPLQFLLFVARFKGRVTGAAEDFGLFVSSIEAGRLCDFFRQTIVRYGLLDKGFEIGVQMSLAGIVQPLCQRGQAVSFFVAAQSMLNPARCARTA